MICDWCKQQANQKEKAHRNAHTPSKHPKHLNIPKKKKTRASDDEQAPEQQSQPPKGITPHKHPPPYIAPIRKPLRHQISLVQPHNPSR